MWVIYLLAAGVAAFLIVGAVLSVIATVGASRAQRGWRQEEREVPGWFGRGTRRKLVWVRPDKVRSRADTVGGVGGGAGGGEGGSA